MSASGTRTLNKFWYPDVCCVDYVEIQLHIDLLTVSFLYFVQEGLDQLGPRANESHSLGHECGLWCLSELFQVKIKIQFLKILVFIV